MGWKKNKVVHSVSYVNSSQTLQHWSRTLVLNFLSRGILWKVQTVMKPNFVGRGSRNRIVQELHKKKLYKIIFDLNSGIWRTNSSRIRLCHSWCDNSWCPYPHSYVNGFDKKVFWGNNVRLSLWLSGNIVQCRRWSSKSKEICNIVI